MTSKATTPEDYIAELPDERKAAIIKLRETILSNLPKGFKEGMSYGMVGYVVPHTLYPAGYHCSPELPLPFMSFASQKNFIALYHMGMYAKKELLDWFVEEYPKHCKYKIDMGKSCIRFKKIDAIPFELIAELVQKMTPEEWIEIYETNLKR
ncbi:protein of unknown function (DU1801) [Pustulibacterium marinum]|uniref:YdhG-like domain-containing protein n=1 Tax=Pustulibacterium marinum TaxID=1224947 RepID=A0A1I7I751_9FLAO|nr:DUF1801 domain-containing protein [Pustulibacterium marinum]SFU68805.1 protein of unknown function (DU1801) [Pustulibacterium marinum]